MAEVIGHEPEPMILYGLDQSHVFFPRTWEPNASKARYRGWKELHDVDMVDCRFDPRDITVKSTYAFRVEDDPFGEVTHRITDDPMVPGAYPVWFVEVEPC